MKKKVVDGSNVIVSMERSDTVQGSQKTVALGQGVKARTAKNSEGRTVVEAFYFDRDRYSDEKIDKWLAKNESHIFESLHYVQMQSPDGSFEDITMRIQAALDAGDVFQGGAYVRIEFVFPDRVVVCTPQDGQLWELTYKDTGTEIVFGQPAEVKIEIMKEKIKEHNAKVAKNKRPNLEIEDEKIKFRLKESNFNEADFDKSGDLVIVIIEAGANYNKRRYYPKKTLQESADIYAGLKMYLDHPTDAEEAAKPERSIEQWLSTIKESWYEDGMVLGRVHIHKPWLKESMKDPVFRAEIGVSINASGRMHVGEIDGQQMQIMDAISSAKSVDWVTEAGARGRVLQLMESAKIEQEHKEIETMDIKEFKEKHKALYEQIVKEAKEGNVQLTEAQIQEKIDAGVTKALDTKNAEALKESKKVERANKIKEVVSGSKLPEAYRDRAIEAIARATESAKDEEFDAKVKEAVVSEIKFLNGFLGKKIEVDPQHKGADDKKSIVESATADILETAGLDKVGVTEEK